MAPMDELGRVAERMSAIETALVAVMETVAARDPALGEAIISRLNEYIISSDEAENIATTDPDTPVSPGGKDMKAIRDQFMYSPKLQRQS